MSHQLAIVIPAYKATFLPAALDSIAAQTYHNLEVIIIIVSMARFGIKILKDTLFSAET